MIQVSRATRPEIVNHQTLAQVVALQQALYEMGANEAEAARHQDSHHLYAPRVDELETLYLA
jgi:hypothetical protein